MASLIKTPPTEKDWNGHRQKLVRLYIEEKKSVREIMDIMKRDHGFIATKHQYNKHLSTQWKCTKYTPSPVWKAIVPHILKLEETGKEAEVFINSKPKSREEVQNAVTRYRDTIRNVTLAGNMRGLPDNVVVRAAAVISEINITHQLPFYVLENQLMNNYIRLTETSYSMALGTTAMNVQKGTFLDQVLRAVVPPERDIPISSNLPLMDRHGRLFASPLHRGLLFSITNNFAGISNMSVEETVECMKFLKREATHKFFLTLASAADLYGVQAFTIQMFRMAVQAGDHETVTSILHQNPPCIDIDDSFVLTAPINGICKMKPIELAARLAYPDVVRTLISFGAKVEHLNIWDGNHHLNQQWYPAEIIEMLHGAGMEISEYHVSSIILRCYEGSFKQRVILNHIALNYQRWNEDRIFYWIFSVQPISTCTQVLKAMAAHGADLSADMAVGPSSITILEALHERCVNNQLLELHNAFPQLRITRRIVFRAIEESGDIAAVKHFLAGGPGLLESEYRMSLLKHAATAAPDRDTLQMVLECLPTCPFTEIGGLMETLVVAALKGNVNRIKELLVIAQDTFDRRPSELFPDRYQSPLNHSGSIHKKRKNRGINLPQDDDLLPWILHGTMRAGQPEAALALVEAGIAENSNDSYKCLLLALEGEHFTLARAILEAGVFPGNSVDTSESSSLLSLVLRNGNTELVQDLLQAGLDINTGDPLPLSVALRDRDLRMAQYLLDHGADMTPIRPMRVGDYVDFEKCPIAAAIQTSDLRVVQFALENGASTDDARLFEMAFDAGHDIFKLVVNEHKCRYSNTRRGWGYTTLRTCLNNQYFEMFKDLVLAQMADINRVGKADLNVGYNRDISRSHVSIFGETVLQSKEIGLEPLEFLLQNKERLNCRPDTIVMKDTANHLNSWSQMSAFLVAIFTGHLPTVELFLQHGACLDLPKWTAAKRTPFQQAVETGSMEIIELLLRHGALVNEPAVYSGGATALQLAAIKGYLPIAKLLLEKGADVDAPPAKINGVTALEGAAQHGRLDTVAFLLSVGAARKGRDKHQLNRAIQHARDEGHVVVEKLLEDFVETGVIPTRMGFFPDLVDLDHY
ncbi:Clr5 domain-containing protein [Apiospora sp. TS-2023a]